ncbi:hypothetical protein BCR42DRAFT_467557 [Absidia repens]|uniref:F-box/LRR-repeat protein 15-like leucin rich repeat domain-containing protein n=1 Tax=Absidia repens TaxID=90262 RepID=A0A1X2IAV7_9FUNG|nr:hypothetical protein BCR42DRAFT_467557 [Absidia repens]
MPMVFKRQNSCRTNKTNDYSKAQPNEQCHLIFQLPEIVEQIIQYLMPNPATVCCPSHKSASTHRSTIKSMQDVLPCLYVNWLWHDCVSRYTWRHVSFEDSRTDYEQFLRFTSVISRVPLTQPCQLRHQWNHRLISLQNHHHVQPLSLNRYFKPRYRETIIYQNRIRSLTLRKIKERNINEPLQHVGHHAPYLNMLDIYICDYVTNSALYSFLEHGQLTYLSLAGCQRITDDAIIQVANTCPHLEHLDLRACGHVSDMAISKIAIQCPLIRHLNVGRVKDRQHITDHSIKLIAKHTQVSVLGLAGCDISDASLILLAELRRDGIERISINNCFRVSNLTVRAYAVHCPNLSVFEMKECHRISDWEAVAALVQRKVLLTLCDQQNRACEEWAKKHGIILDVRAPVK